MSKTDTLPPDVGAALTTRPGETLEAVLKAARIASPVVTLAHGQTVAFLPDGFSLEDISDPHRLPPHIRQAVIVDDADSLIAYVNRFADDRSVIIADLDALSITAVLDWHSQNQVPEDIGVTLEAQPCSHKAALKLRNSEEFARWAGTRHI